MRTRLLATVILLFILCVVFCGCGDYFDAPLDSVDVPNQNTATKYRIYICGAVEHEGYYDAEAGVDYTDVLRLAGLLPESVLPTLNSSFVDGNISAIIVEYYEGGSIHSSINANHPFIAARLSVDGLSDDIVNKLADFIDTHGKFTNKGQLKLALGDEDYAANFYKLYIAEKDYEAD